MAIAASAAPMAHAIDEYLTSSIPASSAASRFCATARSARPVRETRNHTRNPSPRPIANRNVKMSLDFRVAPPKWTANAGSHPGIVTWALNPSAISASADSSWATPKAIRITMIWLDRGMCRKTNRYARTPITAHVAIVISTAKSTGVPTLVSPMYTVIPMRPIAQCPKFRTPVVR